MQARRTARASVVKGCYYANAMALQSLIVHWQSIVKCLNNYLEVLRANYVSGISKSNDIVHCAAMFAL